MGVGSELIYLKVEIHLDVFHTCTVTTYASDPELVQRVFTSVRRHLWYMSEELVPLSLCDRGTPDPDKQSIVKAMLKAGRPQQFPLQQPIMKTHILENHRRDVVGLHEFAGERS